MLTPLALVGLTLAGVVALVPTPDGSRTGDPGAGASHRPRLDSADGPARGAMLQLPLEWSDHGTIPQKPAAVDSKPVRRGGTDPGPTVPTLVLVPPLSATAPPATTAVVYALSQLGRPYRSRADGPNAFDCSGLTLAAYRHMGVPLPHRAAAQSKLGQAVDWVSQPLAPGDLVFTRGGSPRRDVGHVGIAVSPLEWVVAPRTGEDVHREPIPFDRIQVVRRIIGG